jgi:RNA polymerase sigma-70 factor, ECF subfamily
MHHDPTDVAERKLRRLEDALSVAAVQAGDMAAFTDLIRRYERPLLYYLRRLVPHGDTALDVHQEVWIDVFRVLPNLHAPEAFSVWLYQIAHHKAARFIRNEIRREDVIEAAGADEAASAQPESDGLDAEAVHKALALLPPHHRDILTLHYLNDFSTAEIGRVLDCPAGTVKSRLHHARIALRRVIERKNL